MHFFMQLVGKRLMIRRSLDMGLDDLVNNLERVLNGFAQCHLLDLFENFGAKKIEQKSLVDTFMNYWANLLYPC